MEQSTQETYSLEQILIALEEEKAQLEKKLETELEDVEREEIEARIGEIHGDLEIHKIGLPQPSFKPDAEVRRTDRQRQLTEKMREFKQTEITSKERKFMSTYLNFKAEIQLTRSKLKEECSKAELAEMIKSVEKCELDLQQDYVALRALTTPSQDMRRKMDSCTSVSAEMMILLKRRYADVDKEFDALAVKESLLQLLQREGAESIYGSTVSRAGRNSQHSHSQQGSHVSARKAEAAARLASKQAEINREMEISARRKEILAQQEQLKMLENQRDLEVIQAEYNVYAEEESKMNAEIRNCEVRSTLSFSQLPKPLSSPPCTQVPQSTAPPHSEGKFIQTSQSVHAPHYDTQVVPKESELSLVQALKDSLAMSRLPVPEPFTFTGDPLKFVEWSTCFKALIETSCTDSAHKLFYLKKYNEEGHLEMPLPFRERPQLPNNKQLAMFRLKRLKGRMDKNPKYKEDYIQFMNSVFKDGDAEEADGTSTGSNTWYIPHHGVYHPRKPEKIRVVFDCSAKHEGISLNDHLLTGPDLINALAGVLCRFREHQIAIMCDVEKMCHRFHVNPEDRDFLRFLWWKDGNTDTEPKEYRMRVHIFGAASSPGCANYGMKYLAREQEKDYPLAARFIHKNFYVDDGLISIDSVREAKQLVCEAQEVCAKGKLRLHKFACNNKEVMSIIPETERASNTKDVNLNYSVIQMQSVLGVKWNIEADVFSFSVALKERPATRRGILATVASVYDPLGFLSPYILTGKQVLQEMCKRGVGWDEPIPPTLETKWKAWLGDLENLKRIEIPRCLVPENFGKVKKIELHHFSDASSSGYGQCSYIRIVADKNVHCALVMGKARVAPTRIITIPRLELTAAAVSAAVSNFLKSELERKIDEEFFWTDSKVTLGYIKNDARRFHVFVANRVQKIRDSTDPKQWFYIESDQNPADHASRGLKVADLLSSNWLTGPKFLWEREIVTNQHSPDLLVGDPEVKVLKTNALEENSFLERFSRFSNWDTALNVVARIKRLARRDKSGPISVEERQMAAFVLFQAAQREAFKEELKWFSQNSAGLPKTHKMYQLDPILVDNLLRVGGRLRKSSASLALNHPVILPKEGIVTQLVLDHCHKKTQHQGRGQTLNKLRESGYWIIGGSKVVAKYIKGCVNCRKVRGPAEEQRMADLPFDRVDPSPPFTYTGVDVFGPFYTKQGQREWKRYGLLFTCLSSRAAHIEMLEDLSTDAFINALRCFIAIRGTVRQIRSDQGTNFVGAKNEFKKGLLELDKEMISTYLAKNQCDFQMNVPEASHRGGVWERQIRTVRNVMSSVLAQATGRLDDTSLRTFFYEAMSILNHRPLTTDTINDPNSAEPLTPNHLLTMKESVPLPPPGRFVREDLYARKRWRRVQYLTELFWSRWRKEYLTSISLRQRWHSPKQNVQVGDVVILKEDNIPRNEWKLARVVEANEDDDGLVRKVKIQIGQKELGKKGERLKQVSFLERPVQKLVVLVKGSKLQ
ncbi:unnamed protein product [Oreochromis niloticus]|nr:unnamed protein product [Mustela putorius furo]